MSVTPSSYSITMRLHAEPDFAVVGKSRDQDRRGGRHHDGDRRRRLQARPAGARRDLQRHRLRPQRATGAAVEDIDGVTVHKVSDRTFLLHLGGKIEVASKVPLKNRDDLAMAYTPGVGRVSMALAEHPEDVRKLTIKGNSVAVVTDGSAVLGLGNIGPGAACR